MLTDNSGFFNKLADTYVDQNKTYVGQFGGRQLINERASVNSSRRIKNLSSEIVW